MPVQAVRLGSDGLAQAGDPLDQELPHSRETGAHQAHRDLYGGPETGGIVVPRHVRGLRKGDEGLKPKGTHDRDAAQSCQRQAVRGYTDNSQDPNAEHQAYPNLFLPMELQSAQLPERHRQEP